MHDWSANFATISARGGINEPGPNSFSGHSIYTVVDLQAAISIFRDDPHFYNIASYLFCGTLLLVWSIWTLRTRFSVSRPGLRWQPSTAFTLLITYHRPWDAKLVMLAIPPCCMLWARRGRLGKIAFSITTVAALFAGDFPLAAFKTMADSLHVSTAGFGGQLLTLVLMRPESIALLAMGIFYLWTYLGTAEFDAENAVESNLHAGGMREAEHGEFAAPRLDLGPCVHRDLDPWGISYCRGRNAWIDFRAVYAGTRCLIHEHNPYNVSDLEREYLSEDGQRPDTPLAPSGHQLYVNVPTAFVVVAPFALFSWGPALSMDAADGLCFHSRHSSDVERGRELRAEGFRPSLPALLGSIANPSFRGEIPPESSWGFAESRCGVFLKIVL